MTLQSEFALRERNHLDSRASDTKTGSLGNRDIIFIDGKAFRMRIHHKVSGEYVTVPHSIWESVRPKMQETFNRLRSAAAENGGYKNFRGDRLQKITVDMESDLHEIRYTSKYALDSDEEIDEPQIFKLDLSSTHGPVHAFAREQFRQISHITGSQGALHVPIAEETVKEPEESDHSVEATIRRIQDGKTLTTGDLMNYTDHAIRRRCPDVCFLEKRISSPELQGVSGTAPIFADNEYDQAIKAAFEEDRTKPLVIYVHHHPSRHYSTIVAKDGRLFAYDPTGNPDSTLDLNAIYKGIYAKEADEGFICNYAVREEAVRILHTIYETFKTGTEDADTDLRKQIWMLIQAGQNMNWPAVDIARAVLIAALGERYTGFQGAITAAYEETGVDPDTKIKNMIKAASGARAGDVDTYFADRAAIIALCTSLAHQTDGMNCALFVLDFSEYMCCLNSDTNTKQQYYRYLTTSPDPAILRKALSQKLAQEYGKASREEQNAEFIGTSAEGLSTELVTDILSLPPFQSPSGSVNGLRAEIDRTRQAVHELSLMAKRDMTTKAQPCRLVSADSEPVNGFLLFASDGSPILEQGTGKEAFLPLDALNRVAQSAKVYYNPAAFSTDEETRRQVLTLLLAGETIPKTETYQLARRKYIISDNFLIFDEQGRFIPFDLAKTGKTLTAIAPNLRDEREHDLREAEPEARKEHMKALIKDQMYVFQGEECKQLVLPAFGCGQFGWNPEEVATAYKEVLQDLPDYGFDAIHFALPNAEHYAAFDRVFKAGYTGHVPVYLTEKDATGIIRILSENHIRWGELNPGNAEAQVGHDWRGRSTAYEQSRARNSAMIFAQRMEYNSNHLQNPAHWRHTSD